MARILSDVELSHLTIPRLQHLLKAARARAEAYDAICDCGCGARYSELNDLTVAEKKELSVRKDYVNRIKLRLHQLQGPTR